MQKLFANGIGLLMANRIKKFRVRAGLTQEKLAQALGTSQPTFQRWERGQAEVPKAKLKKLAGILDVTPDALMGTHPPVDIALYDPEAPEELQYYGEVAFHFAGGGEPLLLSISEKAHADLYSALQDDSFFVTVESLSNQMVGVRRGAITDVYFSSEAYDNYGPEHGSYEPTPPPLPDSRDWQLVEAISDGMAEEEGFDSKSIERVARILRVSTDEELAKAVADGILAEDKVAEEKNRQGEAARSILSLAKDVIYQLSSGKKRYNHIPDDEVYNAFHPIFEDQDYRDWDTDMLVVQEAGDHRTFFVNPRQLDYVSVPSHKYEAGEDEAEAEAIEDIG